MSTPNPSTPWVPVWDLVPPPIVPTPVNGKWLTAAGGAMVWQDIPGLVTPDSGWITMTPLLNGWVQYADPYGPARYRKLPSGLVVCNGLISSGTVSANAFLLPVGYRPSPQAGGAQRISIFACATGGGAAAEACRVYSDTGAIYISHSYAQSWIDLSGVCFWAG